MLMRFLKYIRLKISIWLEEYGKWIPDSIYLRMKFFISVGYLLHLKQPRTYNEKLQWIKLYDRNPEYTRMVDKIEAKKYVSDILGNEDHIVPTIGVYDHANNIDFDVLPNQFVLKCSHDSGSCIICSDKSSFDKEQAIRKLNHLLGNNFYYVAREWPYKNVKPRIIVEKYICDSQSERTNLCDYKFYCFNGKVDCILVCSNRQADLRYYYFTPDWQFLRWDRKTQYMPCGFTLPKPSHLDEMITLAEKLSSRVKHVRVDLYDVGGKVFFGEYTFFTNCGFDRTITHECDVYLGKKLSV